MPYILSLEPYYATTPEAAAKIVRENICNPVLKRLAERFPFTVVNDMTKSTNARGTSFEYVVDLGGVHLDMKVHVDIDEDDPTRCVTKDIEAYTHVPNVYAGSSIHIWFMNFESPGEIAAELYDRIIRTMSHEPKYLEQEIKNNARWAREAHLNASKEDPMFMKRKIRAHFEYGNWYVQALKAYQKVLGIR
jgi:hypothetical protein